MPPKKQTRAAGKSDVLIDQLANSLTSTSNSGDDFGALDEDVIHRELVKWAGRLELESIDLRDKSSGLIGELETCNRLLTSTSKEMKKDFTSWKSAQSEEFHNAVQLIKKVSDELMKKSSQSVNRNEMNDKLESISACLNSLSNESGTAQFATLSKKLQTVINSYKSLKVTHLENIEFQRTTQKRFDQSNTLLEKCIQRLDSIHNNQIDFNRALQRLNKSQTLLQQELTSLKSSISSSHLFSSTQSIPYLTPDGSYNELQAQEEEPILQYPITSKKRSRPAPRRSALSDSSQNIPISTRSARKSPPVMNELPSRIYKATNSYRKRSQHRPLASTPRQIISNSQPNLDSNCISLLSDDNILSDL